MFQRGLGADFVRFGSADEALDPNGAFTSCLLACEPPGFAANGDRSQIAFRGLVAKAGSAIGEEDAKRGLARKYLTAIFWVPSGSGSVILRRKGVYSNDQSA